ncbi:MAG: pitrilysin family protein [Candidatus Omnitrophota bacterium]
MYKKSLLSNRLRVVTHPMKQRDSVALGIWIGSGGRYENDRKKGAAHFLEHILFKGTQKYSCNEIKELIEGVGGSLNAFTDEEYTCYFAKIPAKHLNETFDILADMVLHPCIARKDVDKERTVILEEIKMYHDLPQSFVLELLDALMWPDHPLGKNLAGSFESISRMSYQDLRTFHKTYYEPSNIVVAACGHLSHSILAHLVQEKFGGQKRQEHPSFLKASDSQIKRKATFYRKDTEQMHVALGAFGFKRDHQDQLVLNLLNVILGANMSSRLFNEVREKRGLAYAIGSSSKSLEDTGILLVRAGVDNKKITIALDVILKELRKLTSGFVTKTELVRAKDYFLGQILLGLEETLDHMLWLGEPMITLNRTRTLAEIMQKVKRVTAHDIKRVAQKTFSENNLNVSIVGPLTNFQEKELKKVLNIV